MVSNEQKRSSSMVQLLSSDLRRHGRGVVICCDRVRLYSGRAFAQLDAGEFLDRPRDSPQRRAKIGKFNEREYQADHPENMHMREQRDQAQDGDDLELQLLRPMRHPLGQRVEAEEQKTKSQDGKRQDDGHDDHKDIGLARRGDERRQMMRRGRVKWLSHTETLSSRSTSPPVV